MYIKLKNYISLIVKTILMNIGDIRIFLIIEALKS